MKTLALEGWNKILGGEYKNTGHTVQFTPGSNQVAYISKGNQRYKVCQFHIHWGSHSNEESENLIDHKAYSGELHIVSVKDKLDCGASLEGSDDALVVGVFLRADDTPGPIANTVWQTLSPVPKKYLQIQEVSVQLDRFLPDDRSYYFYEGSLTTSPYNEIVQRHVLKNPVEIPEAYLSQLRTTLDENGKQVLIATFEMFSRSTGEELLPASTIVLLSATSTHKS